jgi:hypothetical protein
LFDFLGLLRAGNDQFEVTDVDFIGELEPFLLSFERSEALYKVVIVFAACVANPTLKNVFISVDGQFWLVVFTERAIKQMLIPGRMSIVKGGF